MALREAMGDLTQEELAERAGLDQTSISRYLRGEAEPKLSTLQKLEAVLPKLRQLRAKAVA